MKNPQNSSRAGFTLIELLAVIMIMGILMTFLVPRIIGAINQAKVTACKANMNEIFKGMVEYHTRYGRLPKHSGVRFFGSLVRDEIFEANESDVRRLTCPAVELSFLEGGESNVPLADWFTRDNFDLLDGYWSAYAGRDTDNHPLKKFPGSNSEVLVADDNDGGMNHETTTVVLWAGGTVTTKELVLLKDDGILDLEETELRVGPDSPLVELQKLSLD
jgi:prepilin-type N-terminal cleavage/methylation domain-containing protein